MKLQISLIFLLLLLVSPFKSNSQISLNTNFGWLSSGFGDLSGKYGSVGVKAEVFSGFYILGHYGLGLGSKLSFEEQGLKEFNNLLILDEHTENYPLPYIKEAFDWGQKKVTPSTNFGNFNFITLGIGRKFRLGNRIQISLEGGMAWQRVERTYITLREEGEFKSLYATGGESIPVTLAVPFIISFIDYPFYGAIETKYKINDHFLIGFFGRIYNRSDIISTYGLNLETVIF